MTERAVTTAVANPNNVRGLERVGAICESFGLTRLNEPGMHEESWIASDRILAVSVSSFAGQMTGVHVQRVRDWETGDSQELADIKPGSDVSSALLRAVLTTVLGDRS